MGEMRKLILALFFAVCLVASMEFGVNSVGYDEGVEEGGEDHGSEGD